MVRLDNILTIDELLSAVENNKADEFLLDNIAEQNINLLEEYIENKFLLRNRHGLEGKLKELIVSIKPIRKMKAHNAAQYKYESFDSKKFSLNCYEELSNYKEDYKKVYNLLDSDSKKIFINMLKPELFMTT
jgi:hypothetical protein